MARRKYFARRKKVAISIAVGGAAVGLAAVFLVPLLRRRYQQPTITIPENIGYRVAVDSEQRAVRPYDPEQPINESALSFLTPEQRLALEWG